MLSAFKNFAITFLIAALLFGLVGFFATNFTSGVVYDILEGEQEDLEGAVNLPVETEPPAENPDTPPEYEKVPEGDSFTAVFVGTDFDPVKYDNYFLNESYLAESVKDVKKDVDSIGKLSTRLRYTSATWIVLVRADKEVREYAVCYFSPETEVSSPIGSASLGEIYGRYGMDVLCQYLNTMTGLDVDYRFVVDAMNGEDFLEQMGEVEVELGCNIYSGGRYHVSAEYRDDMADAATYVPFTMPELPGEAKDDKKETAKTETEKPKEDEPNEDSDDSEDKTSNVKVLGEGKVTLSNYSVSILNTFKEFSAEDITTKSEYMLSIIKQYLIRCAEMSPEDFAELMDEATNGKLYDFEDPYSDKPTIGTDLSPDKTENVHSMLEALEYFSYTQFSYPGEYSEETGFFAPDITVGHEMFTKYCKDPVTLEQE